MRGVEQSTLWRSLVLVVEADDRNTRGIHMKVTKSVISLVLAGYATQLSPECAAVRTVSDSINCEFIGRVSDSDRARNRFSKTNGPFWPLPHLRQLSQSVTARLLLVRAGTRCYPQRPSRQIICNSPSIPQIPHLIGQVLID